MLASGGVVFVLLILLSIYSLAVIWERWRFFKDGTGGYQQLLSRIRQSATQGKFQEALQMARSSKGLAGPVIVTALATKGTYDEKSRAAERVMERQAARLEKGLVTLGTLGGVAPFIGLLGTVIGVIRAFKGLSGLGEAGSSALAVGIAEALVATAMGLMVAIPAVIAYNYFHARLKEFTDEVGRTSEEVLDCLDALEGEQPRTARRAQD